MNWLNELLYPEKRNREAYDPALRQNGFDKASSCALIKYREAAWRECRNVQFRLQPADDLRHEIRGDRR